MKKIEELIDIEFLYNGNLGRLQQKTIDNKSITRRLFQNEVITHDEYKEAMEMIHDYFVEQLEKVMKDPSFYISD